MGDLGAHTGAVISGASTVLIGGIPAARQGDPHSEPPPTAPTFHGPQVIATGSATVLIEGQPAARLGDMLGCGAALIPSQTSVVIG